MWMGEKRPVVGSLYFLFFGGGGRVGFSFYVFGFSRQGFALVVLERALVD